MKSPILSILRRCKAILRLWDIQEARKRRVEREFQQAWREESHKFIKKSNREIDFDIKLYFDTEFRNKVIAGKDHYYDIPDSED